jgi:WD40 repeat protein
MTDRYRPRAAFLIVLAFLAGCSSRAPQRSLDQLDPADIPEGLRFPGQPREVVAGFQSKKGSAGVVGVAFSPDGRRIAGGFGSGELVVWDSGTGKEVAATAAHKLPISAIVFTPDGNTIIEASYDKTVGVWTLADGELKERARLAGHTDQVWGMALSADGKTLATASTDKTVRIWKLGAANPEHAATIDNNESAWSVALTPDGKTLACTQGKGIALWDVSGAKPERTGTLTGHTDDVWRVRFAPDGKALASAARDKMVRVWDFEGKPKERLSLGGHKASELYGLVFSPDGKSLVSGDYGGLVIRWDLGAGKERNRIQMPDGLRAVTFAPDGRHLGMSFNGEKVYVLRFPD